MPFISRVQLLLAFVLVGWGPFAFAEDYSWGMLNQRFPSVPAACEYYRQSNAAQLPGTTLKVTYTFLSEASAQCTVTFTSGATYASANTSRSGDGCTLPSTYNSSIGACEEPPPPPSECEPKAGQNTTWTMQRPDLNGLGNIEYGCEAGCRIALGTSSCQPSSEGATTGVCYGVGTFTGAECQAGDNPTGGTPPTDPDPTDPPPDCGPGHSWSGTTCVPDEPEECDPSTGEVCPPDDGDGETPNRVLHRQLADDGVLQPDSLAKYAAAFFRMSRSSVTRLSSARRRRSSAC